MKDLEAAIPSAVPMKRPAAEVPNKHEEEEKEGDEQVSIKKRPAATTMKRPSGAFKRPAAAISDDVEEVDEVSTHRDRLKSRKFQQIFSELPEMLQRAYTEAAESIKSKF